MRSLAVILLLLSPPAFATPPELPAKKEVLAEFPIPKDATAQDAPGGGGKIKMYKVPRGKETVIAEVRKSLDKGGWTVTKETKSPSGNALRLEVKHGTRLYKVSFTGDDQQTAIILTLP